MTDAPGNYSAVYIDVQAVEVTREDGSTFMLNTNARVYNILNFRNGLDTLIASGDIDAGTITHVRLILGNNNSVRKDGVDYPLVTSSSMQSGLRMQVNKDLEPRQSHSVLFDFDAEESIVLQGSEYQLNPVLRVVDPLTTGSIRGGLSLTAILATTTATSTTTGRRYSSSANSSGEFQISGLPAGTYNLTITPDLPLLSVTISGVVVTSGNSTNVGIIIL